MLNSGPKYIVHEKSNIYYMATNHKSELALIKAGRSTYHININDPAVFFVFNCRA